MQFINASILQYHNGSSAAASLSSRRVPAVAGIGSQSAVDNVSKVFKNMAWSR